MAIGRTPQKMLALPAGNGEGLELDFDGIVAGRDRLGQKKRRRKREN
jgi:hypothetical protein